MDGRTESSEYDRIAARLSELEAELLELEQTIYRSVRTAGLRIIDAAGVRRMLACTIPSTCGGSVPAVELSLLTGKQYVRALFGVREHGQPILVFIGVRSGYLSFELLENDKPLMLVEGSGRRSAIVVGIDRGDNDKVGLSICYGKQEWTNRLELGVDTATRNENSLDARLDPEYFSRHGSLGAGVPSLRLLGRGKSKRVLGM